MGNKVVMAGVALVLGVVLGVVSARLYYQPILDDREASENELTQALAASQSELASTRTELEKANARTRLLARRIPESSRNPGPASANRRPTPEL